MPRNLLLSILLFAAVSARAETCRFTGTTSHAGRLAVRADTAQEGGATTVDVTVEFSIHAGLTEYRYLGQEISTWNGAALRSVAVNQRSLADGEIKRQQWDLFLRKGGWLEGYRVQAKYLADFRQRHPGFVAHWPPASFGQPWLADYGRANPERRPDLDLPADGTRTPLAFAFYWSRFLPAGGTRIPLVLPSFKRNKIAELQLGPPTPGAGWLRWSSELHHPGLETSPPSLATAWVSADHYLLQLGFDIHTDWASGEATLHTEGCQGVQIRPEPQE